MRGQCKNRGGGDDLLRALGADPARNDHAITQSCLLGGGPELLYFPIARADQPPVRITAREARESLKQLECAFPFSYLAQAHDVGLTAFRRPRVQIRQAYAV